MADPLSITSGIAGLVTLSTAVLAAGYNYVSSVLSAPEDLKSLVRETASLSAILSQFISHSLSNQEGQRSSSHTLLKQDVLRDCEDTLRNIQSLIHDCELDSKHRRKNAVNALLWPLKQKEIIKNRERLGRLCATLHSTISVESASTLRALEHEQKCGNEAVRELARNINGLQEQKILDWLSVLDPTVKHTAITLLKQPGTGEWFLREKPVLDWLHNGELFWLHGISGTGKTVLISSVINHIISGPSEDKTGSQALAYHYCDFSNPSTLDPCNIVGSLVRQLAVQMGNISPVIQNLYSKCSGLPPQLNLLLEALSHTIRQTLNMTYLIIDGLDESPNRKFLINGIRQLCNASDNTSSLRILLSSRPEYDIRQALSTTPSFAIEHQHIKLDIETHVRVELTKIPKLLAMPISAQEILISDLVKRSGGMFRWIQCQLDTLQKSRTSKALKHALRALPAGLDETYDRILYSIPDEDHEHVLRMLHWLVVSERPLSFRELAEAIALNPEKDRLDPDERLMEPEMIFELCGSLIRIEGNQTIVLAHYSVKEYLLSNQLAGKDHRLAKFALRSDHSRCLVSMCILSYVLSIGLKVQSLQQEALNEEVFPLIKYVRAAGISCFQDFDAMDHWMERHLFTNESIDNEWLGLVDYVKAPVLHQSNFRLAWFIQRAIQCALMCFWNGHLAQHNISANGSNVTNSVRVGNMFLRLQRVWESPENTGGASRYHDGIFVTTSPLCTAASFGFEHAMQFLLANGALVDGIPSLSFLGNPLLRVLTRGNEETVRALIDFGANINIRSPRTTYSTALTAAASNSAEFVKYLLEELKIDTNMPDIYGRTIHYWAVHDTGISRTLQPFSARLEALREREVDFFDAGSLYTSILIILKDIKGWGLMTYHYGYCSLSKCLFRCGPEFYDHAAVFAEQGLMRGNMIEHNYHCNLCVHPSGPDIRGKRFVCLECIDVDFCDDCYSNWEKSNGEIEFCKGHSFYEIPRPCWYQFSGGVVMEDGSTLPQVINFLEERFTALLERVEGQAAV